MTSDRDDKYHCWNGLEGGMVAGARNRQDLPSGGWPHEAADCCQVSVAGTASDRPFQVSLGVHVHSRAGWSRFRARPPAGVGPSGQDGAGP
jgi:hypothetical protein